MRAPFLVALFSIVLSTAAFADDSVSGNWRANLGSGVTINMNVTADGTWSSQTLQRNRVVRQMRGTYTQQPSSSAAGTLVFTPTQSSVKGGSVQTETDQYELEGNGQQLKLTADADTMVFKKRPGH